MAQTNATGAFNSSTLTPAYFNQSLVFDNSTFLWTGEFDIGTPVTKVKNQIFNTMLSGAVLSNDSAYWNSSSTTV